MPPPQAGIPWQLYCTRESDHVNEGLPDTIPEEPADAGRGGGSRGVSRCSVCRTPARAAAYYRQLAMAVLEPAAGACGRVAELAERATYLAAEAGCAASRLEEEEPPGVIRAAAAAIAAATASHSTSARAAPSPADAPARGQQWICTPGYVPSEQEGPAAAAETKKCREARLGAARLAGEAAGLLRRAASAMETALSPGNRLLGGTWHRAGRAALLQARCLRAVATLEDLEGGNCGSMPITVSEKDGVAAAAAAAAMSAAAEEAAGSFEKSIAVLRLTCSGGSSLQVASEQLLLLEALSLGAGVWQGQSEDEEARREGVRRADGEAAQGVLSLHFGAEAAHELIQRALYR